jgi:hypothetical protein
MSSPEGVSISSLPPDKRYAQLERDKQRVMEIAYAKEAAQAAVKSFPLPVNLGRMILNAQKRWKMDGSKPSDLSPSDVAIKVRFILSIALSAVHSGSNLMCGLFHVTALDKLFFL